VSHPAALPLTAVAQEVLAQARPPAPTPPTAARPAAQVVRIAVSVIDPMNHFVTGLEANAFHVFENGVEQKIVDFAPQKQPLSLAIVWDEQSELRDLRKRLAQLRAIYKPSFPEIRVAEAQIAEIENRALPVIDVPGSQVSVTEVGKNQSLADGLESALDQLRGTPAEQAAIVLALGPASWADEEIDTRIFALVRAARVPVYPVQTPGDVQARLTALATQLANQYLVGYVRSGVAGPGEFRSVDVRLTPPVGLPQLTARVSSGTR
jgi:Ca-activated chloride channel family protein